MSEKDAILDRIILSFPSLLHLTKTHDKSGGALRSWIQLARTGSFVSNRYGKFSITKDDLSTMLHNFKHITPKAPTQLPIDWDHLSMDPKKPGDGAAAGWMKQLELREDGNELWAQVEWTPKGADAIENKEYRFISPSFVKNHTHKDGQKIGTTLLAAAITNHPFLEGMKALTLYNASVLGDLALSSSVGDQPAVVRHLASIGQRVSFLANAGSTPELTDEERAQTFVVKSTAGDGDDQFLRLTMLDGTDFGWFRATELAPAKSLLRQQDSSPVPSQQPTKQTEDVMQTTTELEKKAAAFAQRVTALSDGRTLRAAIDLAVAQDPEGAESYRLAGVGAEVNIESEHTPVLSLSARPGESFDALVMRYATENNVSLRKAIYEVGNARPDLAAAR